MAIDDIYNPQNVKGFTVIGKVVSGVVSVSDNLLMMPLAQICPVKSIQSHGETVLFAKSGDNVEITLTKIEFESVHKGFILCDPKHPIRKIQRFRAKIRTFKDVKPILKGAHVLLHSQIMNVSASITKLLAILDHKSGKITEKKPRGIVNNSSALVEITCDSQVCMELFNDNKFFGRFMLRDESNTIAAGIVEKIYN